MKNLKYIVLILILVIANGCKEQVQKDSTITATEKSPQMSREEVKGVIEELNKAFINADKQVLEAYCAEQLTYGHSNGLIQNKDEFIDDLVNGPYDFTSVASPDLSIQIIKKTAIARFTFLAEAIKEKEMINIRLGCIQVFQQLDNGEIKLIARQGFKLPEPDSGK